MRHGDTVDTPSIVQYLNFVYSIYVSMYASGCVCVRMRCSYDDEVSYFIMVPVFVLYANLLRLPFLQKEAARG